MARRAEAAPTPRQAVALQREWAGRVVPRWTGPDLSELETVAGADVAVGRGCARAAVCVLDARTLEPLEERTAERPLDFPYVPGLLAFREVPALVAAFERVRTRVDVVLVDGHGLAHPRRFGLACHLGVELDLPTVGCGKSRLVGEHREPGVRRGSRTRLRDGGEVIGVCLRTRERVRPLYVSIGHRIDLETAVKLVLGCGRGVRLPEPIRRADRLAGSP